MQFDVDWGHQGLRHKQASPIDMDGRRRNVYNETETLQLLSQTHLHSPGSYKPNSNEMQRFGQYMRAGDSQMISPHFTSSNYQVQFPSSSNRRDTQQWQSNIVPPQLFATAAASSGFPQQIIRTQNWSQNPAFHHNFMRPS